MEEEKRASCVDGLIKRFRAVELPRLTKLLTEAISDSLSVAPLICLIAEYALWYMQPLTDEQVREYGTRPVDELRFVTGASTNRGGGGGGSSMYKKGGGRTPSSAKPPDSPPVLTPPRVALNTKLETEFAAGWEALLSSASLIHPVASGTGIDSCTFSLFVTPDSGFWVGGCYEFRISIPDEYPLKEPTVRCLDPIYHPNINEDGDISINILRPWKSRYTIEMIALALLFLLSDPNPIDVMCPEPAQDMRDPKRFAEQNRRAMRGEPLEQKQPPYFSSFKPRHFPVNRGIIASQPLPLPPLPLPAPPLPHTDVALPNSD